jgi:hypothetical protein
MSDVHRKKKEKGKGNVIPEAKRKRAGGERGQKMNKT